MSRTRTTFTADAAGRQRASQARLRHGARSETTITARAKTIERQIQRELNELGIKRPLRVRRHAARIEAIVELAHAEIEKHGGLVGDGKGGKLEAAGVSDVYLRACSQLTGLYRELGLMTAPPEPEDEWTRQLRERLEGHR